MHRFDYSEILDDLPEEIIYLMNSIKKVRSHAERRIEEEQTNCVRMKKVARLESIQFSNEIEGITVPYKRFREIAEHGNDPQDDSAEREIAGYRDALDLIDKGSSNLGFDCETILDLHSMLNSVGSDRHAFKNVDNAIVGVDSHGRTHFVFLPVRAAETEDHMQQLCKAYSELSRQNYEPLLYIPCIILDFLSIHPFPDGNGRMSRLLTMMLLYNEGIDVCRFVSMDRQIYRTRSLYYRSLHESSEGWIENDWTYIPFIRYFLSTLLDCYCELEYNMDIEP